MKQGQVHKVKTKSRRGDVSTDWTAPRSEQTSKADLRRELDEVLADIDEALQGVDQDLAVKFIQHGGE